MDTIKTSILTACILGILSTIFKGISPNGNIRKHYFVLITVVTITTIIIPYTDKSFKITLNENKIDDFNSSNTYMELENTADEIMLQNATEKIKEYFIDKFNRENIPLYDIDIKTQLNEYNEIEIKKIILSGIPEDKTLEVRKSVKKDLPETEIIFKTEDHNEAQIYE